MSAKQFLRLIWVRRWVVLATFLAVATIGLAYALLQPKYYTADALLVLDARPDPILGGLGAAAGMTTQIEVIKTGKVAARAVELLGLAKDPARIRRWQSAGTAAVPIERFYSDLLQRDLKVEALRGSNIIALTYSSTDPAFAVDAANAFAQATADVAVGMRVEPARESADWFAVQAKALRANLEEAQANLSKFQQEKGIVVSDAKVSEELARLNALETQLLTAQAARLDTSGRTRDSGSEMSPDVQQSGLVQALKAQLSTAEIKLAEISGVLGSNHPQRVQLEAQIAGLKQQLAAEVNRVAGGASVANRISSQKVDELRNMVELQKKQVLSLRNQRDQIAVLLRDIDTAQRAYDSASQRAGQLSLEGQVDQTSVRMLSPAAEASDVSRKRLVLMIVGSLLGGLAAGAALAIGLEMLNRRVRGVEDLDIGVPVLGVLHPAGHERLAFRRLLAYAPPPPTPLLPMAKNPS